MDNTFAPRGGFSNRMMRSNLRPVVLFIAFATGLWSFLWSSSSFRLVADPNVGDIPGLKSAALSNGIMYTVAAVIQMLGLSAVSMRRARLVKLYAYGSILSALLILAGNLTRIVIHFSQKKALLDLCTNENTGDTLFFSWGIWGPVSSTTLDQAQAAQWCNDAWSRASWSNIVEFIIEIGIAAFFLFLIFGYYKQLLDPSSPAYVPRNQAQYPLGPYPPPQFPPPQGPPPTRDDQSFAPPYDSAKLPAYDGTQQKYGDTKDGGQGLLKAEDDDPFGDFRNDVGRSGSGNARR